MTPIEAMIYPARTNGEAKLSVARRGRTYDIPKKMPTTINPKATHFPASPLFKGRLEQHIGYYFSWIIEVIAFRVRQMTARCNENFGGFIIAVLYIRVRGAAGTAQCRTQRGCL
jgi:hypothetical protein